MRPPRRSWALAANAATALFNLLAKSAELRLFAAEEFKAAEQAVRDLAEFVDTSEECEEP